MGTSACTGRPCDLHIQIEDQIAERDQVATRWTGTGTHNGELAGIAPTGTRVVLPGMEIVRYLQRQGCGGLGRI